MRGLLRQKFGIWLWMAGAVSLPSCGSEEVSCCSVDVSLDGWAEGEMLYIDYHLAEVPNPHAPLLVGRRYRAKFSARCTNQYPFTTIPLEIRFQQADSLGNYQDQASPWRISLQTVDDEGRRTGDTWGSLFSVDGDETCLLQFSEVGDYRLAIRPDAFLTGVASVTATLSEE